MNIYRLVCLTLGLLLRFCPNLGRKKELTRHVERRISLGHDGWPRELCNPERRNLLTSSL